VRTSGGERCTARIISPNRVILFCRPLPALKAIASSRFTCVRGQRLFLFRRDHDRNFLGLEFFARRHGDFKHAVLVLRLDLVGGPYHAERVRSESPSPENIVTIVTEGGVPIRIPKETRPPDLSDRV
jgi:hypothetical protein